MTQMNLPMRQKQNQGHRNRLVIAKAEGVRRGMECEVGASRYKALYKEWINKFLLHSTEIYIQYPIINHNEKNIFKNVCV